MVVAGRYLPWRTDHGDANRPYADAWIRFPRCPETVVQSESRARFVGTARIDGTWCNAFRAGRVYYFTVATELYGK